MKAIGLIMFLFYSILGVKITPSLNTTEPAPGPELVGTQQLEALATKTSC